MEGSTRQLLDRLPGTSDSCTSFRKEAGAKLTAFKRTRQALEMQGQLLQILELPQLMDAAASMPLLECTGR